ncbi:MAG TPA: GNAT family N-acetyltransferase [Propionibacteriaceae bacterium]|nr:GNAT family N-acetyltransferase [Propionibacteriaceae bacterium]
MSQLDELRVGPLTLDDAPRLLDLFHTYDRRFFGEPLMDADDLASDLQSPDFDLATDSLAFRTPDSTLVAGGFVTERGHIEAQFAEGWDHPELRARLVEFGESRARERGLSSVFRFVADTDTEGAAWLADRGYRLSYTAWILRLDPETPIAGRTLPPGYAVRPFELADAEASFAVINAAFGEWDEGPERSLAGWRAQTLDRPSVDPSAFRVATYRNEIIGTCIVFDSYDEAWVSYLAVAKPHRGKGVAQQMLAEAYAAARARGIPNAGLSTDTRTGALDLYLRLGMRVMFTLNNWNLPLAEDDRSRLAPSGRAG